MRYTLASVLIIFFNTSLFAQTPVWQKDYPGKLNLPANKVRNPKAESLFNILNQCSFISQPKGIDIFEYYKSEKKANIIVTRMDLLMPFYYVLPGEQAKTSGIHGSIRIYLNDLSSLRDPQKILFPEETEKLGGPEMFEDTFTIHYQQVNNYNLGVTINTQWRSNSTVFVMNPKNKACFTPVTKDQYIRFWIGKLQLDIEGWEKQNEESTESLKSIAANPSLKATMGEVEKIQKAISKWISFLQEKKAHYKNLLARLTPIEKSAPAFYSINGNVAVMQDKNGNYPEKIQGNLPYELYQGEEHEGLVPIYTYNTRFFDPGLSPSAIQLIVMDDGYGENSESEFAEYLKKELYPNLSYSQMAKIMY